MSDAGYHAIVEERAQKEYDEIIIDRFLMTLLLLSITNAEQDWSLFKRLKDLLSAK